MKTKPMHTAELLSDDGYTLLNVFQAHAVAKVSPAYGDNFTVKIFKLEKLSRVKSAGLPESDQISAAIESAREHINALGLWS